MKYLFRFFFALFIFIIGNFIAQMIKLYYFIWHFSNKEFKKDFEGYSIKSELLYYVDYIRGVERTIFKHKRDEN